MANNWSPKEILADPKTDFMDQPSIDVYSYGMLLWELETSKIPFEGLDQRALKTKLVDEKVRPKIPNDTSEKLKTLIRRCW
mmetsp:Transcript_116734/g.162059  ORF Transcript_116734/g.162059 Transcript_116734/m.162059 type:complete len:81 (+) Transcript_116734:1270-1512(+)